MCVRPVALAVLVWVLAVVLLGAAPVPGFGYVAEFLLHGASRLVGIAESAAWAAVTALLVVLFLGLFAAALALFLGWGAYWLARRYDWIGWGRDVMRGLQIFDGDEDCGTMIYCLAHLLDALVLRETLVRLGMFAFVLLGENPLFFACSFPYTSPGLVEAALGLGADINEASERDTPLDMAIYSGNVPVVWTLLRHGAVRYTEVVPKLGAPAPR